MFACFQAANKPLPCKENNNYLKKKLFLNVSLMRHFLSYFQGNSFSAVMLWCRLTETDPSCSPDVFSNCQTSASPFFCPFSRRKKKDQSKLIKEKINWLSNSAARGIGRSPAVEAAVTWFTQRTLSGSSWEGRDERSSLTLSGRTVKTHHISFSTVGRKTNHLETYNLPSMYSVFLLLRWGFQSKANNY